MNMQESAPLGQNIDSDVLKIRDCYERSKLSLIDNVNNALQCGHLLIAKKATLSHGEWLPWLHANEEILGFSVSVAEGMMRAARKESASTQIMDADTALKISKSMWRNGDGVKTEDPAEDPAEMDADTNTANLVKSSSSRIKLPEGATIESVTKAFVDRIDAGESADAAAQKVGVPIRTLSLLRDMAILANHADLSPGHTALAKEVWQEVQDTKQLTAYAKIRPLVERVWGAKGQRTTADKKRLEQFQNAIKVVNTTCVNAVDIEIPYITTETAKAAGKQLAGAIKALKGLIKRIEKETSK